MAHTHLEQEKPQIEKDKKGQSDKKASNIEKPNVHKKGYFEAEELGTQPLFPLQTP